MTPPLVTLDEIRAAAKNIAGSAVRTPLLPCLWADGLYLKPENLQPVGAFKIRGAAQALASLPAEVRAAGVVTESSGNHGQALAYAGRRLGAPVVVVMPDVAVPSKIEATRLYGAEVMLVPAAERSSQRDRIARERGLTYVPPYDSPDIIAGQGTIGLEVFEDLSDADNVVVPVGGGGLAAGEVRIWPTERTYRTAADGLRTHLSALTLAHLQAYLAGIVTVTEEEILSTVAVLARSARIVAEPSGAVAAAAFLHHRDELPAGRTVAVVSGGNIDPDLLARVLR